MTLSPFGPGLYGGLFSDEAAACLFDDAAELRAMLAFEAALARAQAETGVIPAEAAARIAAVAGTLVIPPRDIAAGTARDGVAVPALVAVLRKAVSGDAAAWVHWGATSQDVADTALIVNLRSLLSLLEGRIATLIDVLADLAARHRHTAMAARTRMQQATPTSFGLKAAGWLAPLIRHRDRLAGVRQRALVLSFAGASGNLSALGDNAMAVAAALSRQLDLPCPIAPWHTARDGLVEVADWLTGLTGTLGKIGTDLILLAQSEVGEVALASGGGSSTMPNKVNPVGPEALVAIARYNATQISAVHHAALQEHERSGAGWQLEWLTLPQMAVATAASTAHAGAALAGLTVNAARMRANIEAANGLLLAEAASFALAAHMPRPEAQALVKAACKDVTTTGRHLFDILPEVTSTPVNWQALRDPALHIGAADPLIDRVLAAI